MALNARYLADKSALARLAHPPVEQRLAPLIENGLVAVSSIVTLEMLFSARSPGDYRATRQRLTLALELAPMDQPTLDRAVEIQALLAERGQHRAVALPDLMIAATAERHRLTVLHYDADFDRIAVVSDVQAEWIVARGSVP
jgi:predicted nucleic acid-binding protein